MQTDNVAADACTNCDGRGYHEDVNWKKHPCPVCQPPSAPEPVKDANWYAVNVGTGMRTPRWHFDHADRRFILYAATAEDASAVITTFVGRQTSIPLPEESGYYCQVTNSIVGAKDGPTSFMDCRKSGGGSRG